MENLTQNEQKVFNVIKETMESYGDGFSDVMFDDIVAETELGESTVKGVLGSLVKKGLVWTLDVNGEYNVYYCAGDWD